MIELEKTKHFLQNLESAPEFKIDKPINGEEFEILQKKIIQARAITGTRGDKQDYPRSLEYENCDYPVGYLKYFNAEINNESEIALGINILEERNGTNVDFWIHYKSQIGDIRFVCFEDDAYYIRVSDKDDRQIFQTKERKLQNINQNHFGIVTELLDNFINATKI